MALRKPFENKILKVQKSTKFIGEWNASTLNYYITETVIITSKEMLDSVEIVE